MHRSNEGFPNLYSGAMNVVTANTATTTTNTTTTTATVMTTISSTTILLLFSSTYTSVCIQTANTFPLQCPKVLRYEFLTVVLL